MNAIKDFQDNQVVAWEGVFENCFSLEDYLTDDPWIGIDQSPFLAYVLKYSVSDAPLLESGCGQGQWVYYLAKRGYHVFGMDFVFGALRVAKEKYALLTFACSDVTKTAFKEDAFGTIISWSVVDHLAGNGPVQALQEMYRTVRAGGTLLITVPCKNYLYLTFLRNLLDRLRGSRKLRKLLHRSEREAHFLQREFSRKEFTSWLEGAGFTIKEVVPSGHEVGFANPINLYLPKRLRLFYNNKQTKRWSGLTPMGQILCRVLKKISPWLTPDEMLFVAVKGEKGEGH